MRDAASGVFFSPEAMAKVIKDLSKTELKALGEFSKAELTRFVKDNFADITSFAFMRQYEKAYVDRENMKSVDLGSWSVDPTDFNPKQTFLLALKELAASYAKHEDGLPPRTFRKLAVLPPLSEANAMGNPNLNAVQNRLNEIKSVLADLFPASRNGKFSLGQLWRDRAREQLEFGFCKELGDALSRNNTDPDAAFADIADTDAGQFLKLSSALRTRLGDDLFAKLGAALRKEAAAHDFGGGADAGMRLLNFVGGRLRGLFENVPASPEEILSTTLKKMNASPEKTDEILRTLKRNGSFDTGVLSHCERLTIEQLKWNVQNRLRPAGATSPSDANLQEAREILKQTLTESLKKSNDNEAGRVPLILRCDPCASDPKGVDILPQEFSEKNGALAARFRAKVALAASVFSTAILRTKGISFDPASKKMLLVSLHPKQDDIIENDNGDDWASLKTELETYEKDLDEMLATVPFDELEVQSQYLATKMNVLEEEMLGGRPILLDALRDGLIGPDVDAASAKIIAKLLMPALSGETNEPAGAIDISAMDLPALKVELELRMRCGKKREITEDVAKDIREAIEAIQNAGSEQLAQLKSNGESEDVLETYKRTFQITECTNRLNQLGDYGRFNKLGSTPKLVENRLSGRLEVVSAA